MAITTPTQSDEGRRKSSESVVTLLTGVGGAGSDVSVAGVLSSSTAFSSSAFFSGVTVVMRVPMAKAGLESFIKSSLLAMAGAGGKKKVYAKTAKIGKNKTKITKDFILVSVQSVQL